MLTLTGFEGQREVILCILFQIIFSIVVSFCSTFSFSHIFFISEQLVVLHAFNPSVGEAATAAAISETEASLIYTRKLSFKNKNKKEF